jgi:hypothetical protein
LTEPRAFFRGAGARVDPTELTRGPWDPDSQHAGPPAALLAREIERCPGPDGPEAAAGGWIVGRITYEILRPVPIAPLTVGAEVVRPGRRVQMLDAALADESGQELIRARAWRLRRVAVELPAGLASEDPAAPVRGVRGPACGDGEPRLPAEIDPAADAFFPTGFDVGYHSAMDYRFAVGGFAEPGPAFCWMRMKKPLVEGEAPTPLQRVLAAADSGNGVSSTLDFSEFLFINVDLSVHLHRMPAGEWIGLDALTTPEPTGIGLSDTVLHDERGPIGRACQTLLIAPR